MAVVRVKGSNRARVRVLGKTARTFILLAAVWLTMAVGVVWWQLDVLPSRLGYHFHPDGERNLFTAVSASALLTAAASIGGACRRQALPATSVTLGAVLAGMAVDEWLQLHEHVERRLGIDWNVLYLPIVALAGASALLAVRRLWPSRSALLLLAGGTCWFVAYLLEDLQWDATNNMHRYYLSLMVSEELLELGGSLLLAASALLAYPQIPSLRPPPTFAAFESTGSLPAARLVSDQGDLVVNRDRRGPFSRRRAGRR